MGNDQIGQINNKSFEVSHHIKTWSGHYSCLAGKLPNRHVIQKTIHFHSHKEASIFVDEFQQISEEIRDFFIINPLRVELFKENMCALSESVNVYHNPLLPSLAEKIKKMERQMKETEIWFILNEISHSLEILHSRKRPHLWICLETIFYNENDNWMVYDMSYWQGINYQSSMKKKYDRYKNKEKTIISMFACRAMQRNEYIDLKDAFDEDIYCFGLTILYLMNGNQDVDNFTNLDDVLDKCLTNYSQKLIRLVRTMIEGNPSRRITLQKLRMKLNTEEEEIMRGEMLEFKREKELKTQRSNRFKTEKCSPASKDRQELYLTATKQKNTPATIETTALNTPMQILNTSRKSFILYSPPTKRKEMKSPNFERDNRSNHIFTYSSPRKF